MTERGIVHLQAVDGPVTNWELDKALAYVKANCLNEHDEPIELEKAFLRVLFDTARETRKPRVILPLHVAHTIGTLIYKSRKDQLPKYEGYKRGVMKIFADRSASSSRAQAKKRASLAETRRTGKRRPQSHPDDQRPKHKGQLILL